MKECILIVNHDTGEYRLEKLNSNIAVKKTRWVEQRKMLTNHVTTISSTNFAISGVCVSFFVFSTSFGMFVKNEAS